MVNFAAQTRSNMSTTKEIDQYDDMDRDNGFRPTTPPSPINGKTKQQTPTPKLSDLSTENEKILHKKYTDLKVCRHTNIIHQLFRKVLMN